MVVLRLFFTLQQQETLKCRWTQKKTKNSWNEEVHGRISRVLDTLLEISQTKVVLQNNCANDNRKLVDSLLCSIESCSSQLHELIVKGDENIAKYSGNTSSAEVTKVLRQITRLDVHLPWKSQKLIKFYSHVALGKTRYKAMQGKNGTNSRYLNYSHHEWCYKIDTSKKALWLFTQPTPAVSFKAAKSTKIFHDAIMPILIKVDFPFLKVALTFFV